MVKVCAADVNAIDVPVVARLNFEDEDEWYGEENANDVVFGFSYTFDEAFRRSWYRTPPPDLVDEFIRRCRRYECNAKYFDHLAAQNERMVGAVRTERDTLTNEECGLRL